jgi:protein SCO1/2
LENVMRLSGSAGCAAAAATRFKAAALAAAALLFAVQAHAEPAALRGLTLTDHRGLALTPASLQGRVLLLNFVFAGCSTTCPVQVQELRELHASLPQATRQRLTLLSVTVDPLSDTPAALAAYAQRQNADRPGWRFISGDPKAVHAFAERMQALDTRKPGAGPADHRTSLYLFDSHGELAQRFHGVPVDRVRLAREIAQLTNTTGAAAAAKLP